MIKTYIENSDESLKSQFYTCVYGNDKCEIISKEVTEVVDVAEDIKMMLFNLLSKIDCYSIVICNDGKSKLFELYNTITEIQKMLVEYGDLPF